jgi:DNA-binding NarL/FixJ family response regulator
MSDRLRVVLAEDSYLVREGTRRVLEETGEVEVVATVGDATSLLDAVAQLHPDAVIADIRMPPSHRIEGIDAARQIHNQYPGVGVVILSQFADEAYAFELLKDGTAGLAYLLKDRVAEPEELLRALRETCSGRSMVDSDVVEALIAARATRATSPLRELTPRELDVLREMASGGSNSAIGRLLHLSESGVEKYVTSIFSKLGLAEEPQVHRRVTAVLRFLESANTQPGGGPSRTSHPPTGQDPRGV